MKSVSILLLACAVALTAAAPSRVVPRQGLGRATSEEILEAAQQAAQEITAALKDAAAELNAALAGEAEVLAKVNQILGEAKAAALLRLTQALNDIQQAASAEEAAAVAQEAVEDLRALGRTTLEAVQEAVQGNPQEDAVKEILARLEGRVKAALDALLAVINSQVRLGRATIEEIVEATRTAATEITTALLKASGDLTKVLAWDPSLLLRVQVILERAQAEATAVLSRAVLDIQGAASVEEAAAVARQAIEELKELGQATLDAILNEVQGADQAAQVQEILARLEGKIKAALGKLEAVIGGERTVLASKEEILAAAQAAATEITAALVEASNQLKEALSSDPELLQRIQAILDEAKLSASGVLAQALTEIAAAASAEEAAAAARSAVEELKQIGRDTLAAIQEQVQGSEQEAQVREILAQLEGEIKAALEKLEAVIGSQ